MIGFVRELYPSFSAVEQAPILDNGLEIGWHTTLLDDEKSPISSGCGGSMEVSRRIALAEAIERGIFRKLTVSHSREFKLDAYPSTCGFAAGYDKTRAMWRAICEGVERWAWSKWIDEHFRIMPSRPKNADLGRIGSFFGRTFQKVDFFEKQIFLDCLGATHELRMGIAIAFDEKGAYPGSRVCSSRESPWEHALIEAWRHKVISAASPAELPSNIYYERVKHFSRNLNDARAAIKSAELDIVWPKPNLTLLREVQGLPSGVFVWRALSEPYVGWHLGDSRRFVY